MAYFLVASSGHAAPLSGRTTFIGSDPQVEIPIRADLGLAPRHFVVVQNESGHSVQSLANDAPVMVNGQPVQFQDLKVGDWIQAGPLALCYQSDTPVNPASPSPPPVPESYYVSPPPEPPSESVEPRRGYRPPESPRPLDMDDEGAASPVAALPNLGRAMAVSDRARAYVEEQKANQSMSGGVVTGVLAALVLSFVWSLSNFLPSIVFFALVGGFGYIIGYAVKLGGKGFDLKFGYTGALCALLAGLVANYSQMSEDMAIPSVPAPSQVERYEEDDDEPTYQSHEEALSELGIDTNSPEFAAMLAASESARYYEEDTASADDEDKSELADGEDKTSTAGGSRWIIVMLYLFGPRALFSYFIAMGAAYKASFRTLTADEAARMQYG